MQWYNPPTTWTQQGDALTAVADAQTDFWRVTRHDFIKDDGHFYYQEVTGDFTASVRVTGQYSDLYDQAGLMLRANETTWLKCGIEYLDGAQQASVVVTRSFSDWSITPLPANPASVWVRVGRTGAAVEVSISTNGEDYTMLRDAYLTDAPSLAVGMMCAAPKGNGFEVRFEGFKVAGRT